MSSFARPHFDKDGGIGADDDDSSGGEYESDDDGEGDSDDDYYEDDEEETETDEEGTASTEGGHPLSAMPLTVSDRARGELSAPDPPTAAGAGAVADIRASYGAPEPDLGAAYGGAMMEDAASQASTAANKKTEHRLELAFEVCGSWPEDKMDYSQFCKALGVLGKRFTTQQLTSFWTKALRYAHDAQIEALREEQARVEDLEKHPEYNDDENEGAGARSGGHGGSKKTVSARDQVPKPQSLRKEEFVKYYMRALVKEVDASALEGHFRALVEGTQCKKMDVTAESTPDEIAADRDAVAKKRAIYAQYVVTDPQMFVYSKDLRQVMTSQAEKLSDEEADELIRECRPKYDEKDPPGYERIYFEQFVAMLTDDTL